MTKHQMSQATTCPVARSVEVIADRWALLIVRDAFDGVRRFGDFQQGLGVARSVLANRLKSLVEAGIFQVQPASDGTSYQEYVLTRKGQSLFPVVVALRQWGEKHLFAKNEPHSVLVDKRSGRPVPVMSPQASDGGVLSATEAEVRKVD